jgi:hypothetical protein
MTMVKELIATLGSRNPNAQVFLMTQRKQPFENHLAGVVGRDNMADQQWRVEPGIAYDDVFLVVGKRIRPGSLSAWIVAEHRAAEGQVTIEPSASNDDELMAATLADIAREQLRIDSLHDAVAEAAEFHCLGAGDLRRALEAAYRAGSTARERANDDEAAQPLDGVDTVQAHIE